jgi:thiamine-phosphate pyrophosphorylase
VDGLQRRARLARSRLCLAVDARPGGEDLLDAALRGGVDVVRLRTADVPDDEVVAAAGHVRRACDVHGALFLLDGRPDLVEQCGADGVHAGQGDASDARRAVGPDRLVGVSAATHDELGAVPAEADYVEVDTNAAEILRVARDTLRKPWFAAADLDVDAVVAAGAPGLAVAQAVIEGDDPEAAARALRAALPQSDAIVGGSALLPQLELIPSVARSGESVRAHTHRAHADVFYVLDGELEFRLGDETVRVPAGSCVTAPPGVLHGFRNPTGADVHYLNLHAPGIWARGHAAGLEPAEYDTFGPEDAAPGIRGYVSGPGDGDRLTKEHRLALVKAQLPELDVLEYVVNEEYDGAGPHFHARHTDCFYVIEGELEVVVDGHAIRAEAGTAVVVPPGVVHAFTSIRPTRFLNVHAPDCGFVEYLRGGEDDGAQYDVHSLTP